MRAVSALGTMGLLLAACAAPVPGPAPDGGVGFGSYAEYELDRARREAALTGATTGALIAPPLGAAAPVPPGGIPTAELAAAGIGVAPGAPAPAGVLPGAPLPGSVTASSAGVGAGLPPVAGGTTFASGAPPLAPAAPVGIGGPDLGRTGGLEASPGNAAPALVGVAPAPNSGGISDEQDFDAVASRESIESDAQRRAEAAAQYAVIQPQELPPAPADTGPDIVAYALSAPNARGQEWYSRFAFSGEGRAARNCTDYRSPDEAQRDFLARGGPDRDPRGIDPDGDGFACAWDPAPFRAAVGRG